MKSQSVIEKPLLFIYPGTGQFACRLGAQPSTADPQQAPTSAPQVIQPLLLGTVDRGTPDEAIAMLQKAVAH